LALEGGHVEFDRFRRVPDRGEESPQSTAVLSQPDSWENNANYLNQGESPAVHGGRESDTPRHKPRSTLIQGYPL